jgi:hypothetical protein
MPREYVHGRIGSRETGSFFGARPAYCFPQGNQPACVLILCTPSCGLDQMFGELRAVTARAMPEIGVLVAIAAKHSIAIEPPAD